MYRILLFGLLFSCGPPEYSLWQSDASFLKLNDRSIERLNDEEFEPFSVAITGDTQVVVGHLNTAKDRINNRDDISFTALLGDITDRGLKKEWMWAVNIIKKFDKPFIAVVGNHDGLNNAKDIYPKLFGDFNFFFDYRGVRFVGWNNNPFEWGPPDIEWLHAATDVDRRVVIMTHQPINDGYDSELWQEVLDRRNIIAAINGHLHNYGYQVKDGVPYYTVARVKKGVYGTMAILDSEVLFYNCARHCEAVEEER